MQPKIPFEEAKMKASGTEYKESFEQFEAQRARVEDSVKKVYFAINKGKREENAWKEFYSKKRLIKWFYEGAKEFHVDPVIEVKHPDLPYHKFRLVEKDNELIMKPLTEYVNAVNVSNEFMNLTRTVVSTEEQNALIQTFFRFPRVQQALKEAVDAGYDSIRVSDNSTGIMYFMPIVQQDGFYQFGETKKLF